MKNPRGDQEEVSLALSLSTDSSASSEHSGPAAGKRARRRGPAVATSGEGEFVCKTCSRAFTSFQALGGHRTSHLRARGHGLELGVGARAMRQHKAAAGKAEGKQQQHECHICGLGFEMGQALGGHMRRHRDEMNGADAADQWVWRTSVALPEEAAPAAEPPVLLELFA